jgi:hypothetical protein
MPFPTILKVALAMGCLLSSPGFGMDADETTPSLVPLADIPGQDEMGVTTAGFEFDQTEYETASGDAAGIGQFIEPACYCKTATEEISPDWLRLNTPLSYQLLDFQNRQTDKELLILHNRARYPSGSPQITVGAQARLSFLAATTNTSDKFPYLGRFPTDFSGDSATDVRMLQTNMHLTAAVTPWATVYGELLFSDVFTFASFDQGSLQARQAYAVFGDFRQSPFFAYVGKKNIGFGDLQTLNPFTQSVVWHYFAVLAEGAGVGYHDDAWDVTVSAINGGRGIRVNDSVAPGKLNNFAVNAALTLGDHPDLRLRVGGGILYGTIYDGFTAEHVDENQFGTFYNSAWDVNARLDLGRWVFGGEFISTTRPWPVTDTRVSAFRAEAACHLETRKPSRVSVSWSEGTQGPTGSEFEFNNQLVLGYGVHLHRNAFGSVEYVRSGGFAPLINITTVSDRSVVQNSLVMGMNLVF